MALLVIGLGLYFADLDVDLDVGIPGLDVAGIAAGVCIIAGVFLLSGDVRVGVGTLVAVSLFATARAVVRYRITRFGRYRSRGETVVGQTGYTTTVLEPRGSVKVDGELWSAVSDSGKPIGEGAEVIVSDVDGLTLKVFEVSETDQ
jgi:membrane-bound ClpP family serine protease